MKFGALIPLLTFILLNACAQSSIKPIDETPPYQNIDVQQPFSWGRNSLLTIRVDYPKGTYIPTFEDEKGFYYQAPQKLTGSNGGMPILLDGGIYLEKGKAVPDKLYFVRSRSVIVDADEQPVLELNK